MKNCALVAYTMSVMFAAGLLLARDSNGEENAVPEPRNPQAKQAIEEYHAAIKRAKVEYDQKLAKATSELQQKLDAAMKLMMKNGNLEEANRIQAARKNVLPATSEAKVYLSDLDEGEPTVGLGPVGIHYFGKKGSSPFGKITINGKYSANGLFTSPPSNSAAGVSYRVKGYKRFVSGVAINDTANASATPLTFVVYGDNKVLWRSKPVQQSRHFQQFDLDISGVAILRLEVRCPGLYNYAHAVWIDPYIQK